MALAQPSDHLALLNAYREWRFIKNSRGRIAANEYAYENLMHVGGLQVIEKTSEQLLEMLVEWNLAKDLRPSMRYNNELGDPHLNLNSDVQPLVFALLTAGLMPNLAVQTTPVLLQTSADPKALIHPGSLNNNAQGRGDGNTNKSFKTQRYLGAGPPGTIILYSNKATNQGGVFLRDTSVIGPVTGLMFSAKLEVDDERSNTLQVDDWLPFKFESGVVKPLNQFISCVDSVCPPPSGPYFRRGLTCIVSGTNVESIESAEGE
jgi:ATP-dependent RNA helicase DHX36